MSIEEQLKNGFQTAFIDGTYNSNLAYRPEFISNDYTKGRKVLSAIENELRHCDKFYFSVAFIKMGGITPLLEILKELEQKNIPGKILTTDYTHFNDPEALDKLNSLSNIELKMYMTEGSNGGFHTKGYIFETNGVYKIITGSSNLTLSALTSNKEWNLKMISTDRGEYFNNLYSEFQHLWYSKNVKPYSEVREQYISIFNICKNQRKLSAGKEITDIADFKLTPNKMQCEFIENLQKIKNEGNDKALLISATGTGKTYASAFAMREERQKKVLFLAHREQLLVQAMNSYKRVLSKNISFGLISGSAEKNFDADYIFATMQTMSKEEIMSRFSKDYFETIIIDEAHRTGAKSYQKIMNYFEPNLWLGMTASPERPDDFDVFGLFDHNIACEIRLKQALEENMLCPFHYFGIKDIDGIVDFDNEDENDASYKNYFKLLTSRERVRNIIEKAEYYGHSGDRVKGLIFVSRVKEGEELSRIFNENGYHTLSLSGANSEEERENAINRLTSDEPSVNKLDYIFTTEIFNEGVDIPEVNQIIMLRPTKSPIVFVQQLGRGLRKTNNKEYVVILDFIGNYKNNFMIPIALSGDRSYNKDNIRQYVIEGERIIPGSSTIHFDEISRKRIFAALDNANFSEVSFLRDKYKNLKNKIGHIPSLMDFDKYGDIDVLRIFENKTLGSYYNFLVKYEKEYKVRLNKNEAEIISFVSQKLANGKRIEELELLERMLSIKTSLMNDLSENLKSKYDITISDKAKTNIVNVLTNEFQTGSGKNTFKDCIFINSDGKGDYNTSSAFEKMLLNPDFKNMLSELISFGKSRYEMNYKNRYKDSDFVLYQKYTYEDVCRLLNWKQNIVPLNIGGYKYDDDTKTFPVFINYDKSDDITETTKYEDHFLSNNRLIAISKNNRSLDSDDVQNFWHAKDRGINVELFVRKNKDDAISKEFYFLGNMLVDENNPPKEFIMQNTDKTAVEFEWVLDTPVRDDIYEYITN
jgi:superfamily II DNA or RNA helicase